MVGSSVANCPCITGRLALGSGAMMRRYGASLAQARRTLRRWKVARRLLTGDDLFRSAHRKEKS